VIWFVVADPLMIVRTATPLPPGCALLDGDLDADTLAQAHAVCALLNAHCARMAAAQARRVQKQADRAAGRRVQ
jgi:hypothetical protein